jgi:acetyl-CoA carboxylase biotin carboxyl carrier protein
MGNGTKLESADTMSERANSARESRPFNMGEVKSIIEYLAETDVSSFTWARGEDRITIKRGAGPHGQSSPHIVHHAQPPPPSAAPAPAAAPAVAAKPEAKPGQVITSPFVGTFYRASSPETPPFVDVGSVVRKGQVLCIVEAMKLMNEIESEVAGKVAEVFAQNGHAVEFGEPLFRIEPA